jgi:hypothetical protein
MSTQNQTPDGLTTRQRLQISPLQPGTQGSTFRKPHADNPATENFRTEPHQTQKLSSINETYRSPVMMPNQANTQNTGAWIMFTYISFGAAMLMTLFGVWALDGIMWVKGYMMMAIVFLVGSTFTLAKTIRDEAEAKRMASRIEEARTEKLLMEVNRR